MDAMESGRQTLRAYTHGYLVAFDIKDGMEISVDAEFDEAPEAFTYCQELLFNDYADTVSDEDDEGRTFRQLEDPAELRQGFQELSMDYMFFRLSDKHDDASLEDVMALCRDRCFFAPWHVFHKGKLVYSM